MAMMGRAKRKADYFKLSLPEAIKQCAKREVSFSELTWDERTEVLVFIKSHHIDLRIFGEKGYDVLSKRFFAVEFLLDKDELGGPEATDETKTFETFIEFFEYVRGDIYENSCFYGYEFSQKEIRDYSIKLERLNFCSLVKETIEDYSFESIAEAERKNQKAYVETKTNVVEWFRRLKPISTLEELEAKSKDFTERFGPAFSSNVFFSLLLKRDKELTKEAAIEYVCKYDIYSGLSFDDILLTYGKEAAQLVIENFVGGLSLQTQKKRKRRFAQSLAAYISGTCSLWRRVGFNQDQQLYYVFDKYVGDDIWPITFSQYFHEFSELKTYVNGDLSDADLSNTSLSLDELDDCTISARTKLPLPQSYSSYEVEKGCTGSRFWVTQRWFDGKGRVIRKQYHSFDWFFDFVHFLSGDLSDADFLLCEGVENLTGVNGLNLNGIKVRSEAAKTLGLPLNLLPKDSFKTKSFEVIEENESKTEGVFIINRPADNDYSTKASYVSDIHLVHRFLAHGCKTKEDELYVVRSIARSLASAATDINLIAGDTSSDFRFFKSFVWRLASYQPDGDFFFTLGNHELWGFRGETLSEIIQKYAVTINEAGEGRFHLVQNNIFYLDAIKGPWKEISEEELSKTSAEEIRAKMRKARVVIFGGLGFAGMNQEVNANNGIYMGVLDREEEIYESSKFFSLYRKVISALADKNLIILTHMPIEGWGGSDLRQERGVVYVSGHDHRNVYFDDGVKRIYADNQIGYKRKGVAFKQISINQNYDWFSDYKDGIFEITKEDYANFYRGINEPINFNWEFEKLYMVKHDGAYMFLMQTPKGTLLILNGGAIKGACGHTPEYFYEHLANYSKSVRLFLSKYDQFQKQVSNEVKRFGGDGRIHGSIIDIDFNNHLYLNPLDGSITPYYALSIVDKYVFDNVPSLLKTECPSLFENYERLIGHQSNCKTLVTYNGNFRITKRKKYVESTEMYRVSRLLKGLQFTTKYNIVRLWNDAIVSEISEENGRLAVAGIINSLPMK